MKFNIKVERSVRYRKQVVVEAATLEEACEIAAQSELHNKDLSKWTVVGIADAFASVLSNWYDR